MIMNMSASLFYNRFSFASSRVILFYIWISFASEVGKFMVSIIAKAS